MKRSYLPDDWLEQIKQHYPKRKGSYGWWELERHVKARLNQFTWEQIDKGTRRYRNFAILEDIYGTSFVMQPIRFYGTGCYFMEDWQTEIESAQLNVDDTAQEHGLTRAEGESDESLNKRIGIAQTRKLYQT